MDVNTLTRYFDIVHSWQYKVPLLTTNYLHIQSIRKNIQWSLLHVPVVDRHLQGATLKTCLIKNLMKPVPPYMQVT
jgi:hypothetical protein